MSKSPQPTKQTVPVYLSQPDRPSQLDPPNPANPSKSHFNFDVQFNHNLLSQSVRFEHFWGPRFLGHFLALVRYTWLALISICNYKLYVSAHTFTHLLSGADLDFYIFFETGYSETPTPYVVAEGRACAATPEWADVAMPTFRS